MVVTNKTYFLHRRFHLSTAGNNRATTIHLSLSNGTYILVPLCCDICTIVYQHDKQ